MKLVKVMRLAVAIVAVVAVTAATASKAEAAAVLTLTSGADVVIVTDGGAGDANAAAGAITYVGAVGANWWLNVTTGLSQPVLGSLSAPHMDLSSVNVSIGAGTLEILFTDTGFTYVGGNYIMAIGGTADGTVDYEAFADGCSIDTLGPFGPGAFSGSGGGSCAVTAPVTLEQLVTVTHDSGGATSFDAELKVPEPASLALLGLGLFGTAIGIRRRNRG